MTIDVVDGLPKAPSCKARKSKGNCYEKRLAKWLTEHQLKAITHANRMWAEASRGQERKATDDEKDNSTRDVANSDHQADERAPLQHRGQVLG